MKYYVAFSDGSRGTIQTNVRDDGGVYCVEGSCLFVATLPWLEARHRIVACGGRLSTDPSIWEDNNNNLAEVTGMITWRTPRITIQRPQFADEIRKAMVANAMWSVGLEAGNPETRGLFEQVLGPVPGGGKWDLDRPFKQWYDDVDKKMRTQGVSTCAMTALGTLRWIKPDADGIMRGYAIGTGLGVAIGFASRCKGWQLPVRNSGLLPGPGAIVQLSSPMHVLIVESYEYEDEDPDKLVLVSVDGGQTGIRGLQAIRRVKRPVHVYRGMPHLGPRPIGGWIEPDLLAYRGFGVDDKPTDPGSTISVPEGWESVSV